MTIRRATFSEKLAINDLLKDRLKILETGHCQYVDPGDSDLTIAKEVENTLSSSSVASIRKEMFGRLTKTRPSNSELEFRFNKLLDILHDEMIVDALNLKIGGDNGE